ncbi:MAG TPA: Clp protease N-terminal domain-containing protein [Bryobacteraceae bacterium]|jgi:hypothetical protein
MFERYNEPARRSIFFARYEASAAPTGCIETEHLLLGLLREDPLLRGLVPLPAVDKFRGAVAEKYKDRPHLPTSLDMPLSQDCRRALSYAAEEAHRLHSKPILPGHLAMGLLRIEDCAAAAFLRENGIDLEKFRQVVWSAEPPPPAPDRPREADWEEAPETARRLYELVRTAERELLDPQIDPGVRLKRRPWTRKEAVGHMIDRAAAHQQWLARALTEPRVNAAGYPGEEWVAVQQYGDMQWLDLVNTWIRLNELLVEVLKRVPEQRLETPCRIGIDEPIPLKTLLEHYVGYTGDVLAEILMKGQ